MTYSDLLQLIDDRSTAFRAAIVAAPSLDAPVPTCPGWTLLDLVRHIGVGRQFWAAIVTAGPADAPPVKPAPIDSLDRDELLTWVAASTQQLLDALREAGPDQGCWTWWGVSQSPQTAGAVARHQLQELAVHTYDAQLTAGAAQPLPEQVALDGVDEFLTTCVATPFAWPHEPVVIGYHAAEGRSWRVALSGDGAQISGPDDSEPGVSASGTASDLVLFFYGRLQTEQMKVDGDPVHFDRLIAWEPGA